MATDIAARGIDVDDIALVVNYDLPADAEDYVHRIGRTARAQRSGRAVSFVMPEETPALRLIERLVGERLPATIDKRAEFPAPPPLAPRPDAPRHHSAPRPHAPHAPHAPQTPPSHGTAQPQGRGFNLRGSAPSHNNAPPAPRNVHPRHAPHRA